MIRSVQQVSKLQNCGRYVCSVMRWSHSDAAAAASPEKVWESPEKLPGLPLVYISGEEMTRYAATLMMKHWIYPHIDTSSWEFYDLSCAARDATDDQVLIDAVEAGSRIGAIFKEPTVTPSALQVESMGLKKALPSPNGAMRRGWNGVTISRDTIHIEGIELGFKKPVLFERHAVGGEYGAGWREIPKGRLITTFFPDDEESEPQIVDARRLCDSRNVAVVYHNPLDNVETLADHFFARCLEEKVTPYVVTKKTVFKWQEPFWDIHKRVFDAKYKTKFIQAGLLDDTGNELQHLISDAATMQIIRWTRGGFGMSAHNYDGDMLTDEVAQVHRSPGFITSNLVGKTKDGTLIKEFEASHGTVADLWHAHLRGEPTSFNPLGMAEALMGALAHAAALSGNKNLTTKYNHFVTALRKALHNTFRYGQGTWDMAGKETGLTTEEFVSKVGWRLGRYLAESMDIEAGIEPDPKVAKPSVMLRRNAQKIDLEKVAAMFNEFDVDGNGSISLTEFEEMIIKLGLAPLKSSEAPVPTRTKIQEKTEKV
uniref:EF-hand domain-containing protein n=1 Tax=Aureoumbra lagunensis TaxID=44058 RepID=A0A6S8BRJ9_9STRA|mmetsp:Transcript_11288/g.15494  ORF Transcript_11288/g.15494 Transcript_11288/m.15494 type:complete len:540 (-) Transcript_11288:153-1772(-)